MEYTAWPHMRSDLCSTRQGAAVFLDNLDSIYGTTSRQDWGARWTSIGHAQYLLGDQNLKKGASAEAIEAWLCALTSFEVARRLLEQDGTIGHISVKISDVVERFASAYEQSVEKVQISCCDHRITACYLRAGNGDVRAPAVICLSMEEEPGAVLLGRLLPVVVGRGLSVMVLSHDDISSQWRGQAELLLSCCLDHLSLRPDVDQGRIGVYGEGLSAVLASDFAASDDRVAAAVCDGGLWNWARNEAAIGWITRSAAPTDENMISTHRSRFAGQLRRPVLVVAGGRGMVSVTEAFQLKADCVATQIDLDVAMPRVTQTSLGDIENFVISDDCIFGWLKQKLAHNPESQARAQ